MKGQDIKDSIERVKTYVKEMPPKKKKTIGLILGAIIFLAVLVTAALNTKDSEYRVMYAGMEAVEASSVYQTLKELGAEPQQDADGNVLVATDEYEVWLYQLAGLGYPKTTLSYDHFLNNAGMTSTESETQQLLLMDLQERIQGTLKMVHGIADASVIITIPETGGSVWYEVSSKERAKASVLLTLDTNTTLSGEQVQAIKNLISSALPNAIPEDVTVVDASTTLELTTDNINNMSGTNQNLIFQEQVQEQIDEKIVRLLSTRYGVDGVAAVSNVTIDYDKMITESYQLLEIPPDEFGEGGGGGYTTHTEGTYTSSDAEEPDGIVGEEDNTDIPDYVYDDLEGLGAESYAWSTDTEYSYIKTQVEKGAAVLERATVSVMVDEPEFTDERREELIGLISSSADIDPTLIFVSSFYTPDSEEDAPVGGTEEPQSIWETIPIEVYIAVAVVVILIIVGIIFLLRRRKRRKAAAKLAEEEALAITDTAEIDTYKQQLSNAAKDGISAKDEAIMTEVRDFAKVNPEITANLLRAWIKEDED